MQTLICHRARGMCSFVVALSERAGAGDCACAFAPPRLISQTCTRTPCFAAACASTNVFLEGALAADCSDGRQPKAAGAGGVAGLGRAADDQEAWPNTTRRCGRSLP